MKKVSVVVLSAILLGAFTASSFAASLSGIGYIDVQKVFKGYKEAQKAQDQISKEESSFKKEFEDSQKKIEEAKAAKKSDKDIESLTKDLENTLRPKRDKLMQLSQALTEKIQKSILTATKDVKKNLGLDVVLDKQVIIDGGQDISDMVINKLNSK